MKFIPYLNLHYLLLFLFQEDSIMYYTSKFFFFFNLRAAYEKLNQLHKRDYIALLPHLSGKKMNHQKLEQTNTSYFDLNLRLVHRWGFMCQSIATTNFPKISIQKCDQIFFQGFISSNLQNINRFLKTLFTLPNNPYCLNFYTW